jgi:ribosomal-protein-alanine N-acetyltransferase
MIPALETPRLILRPLDIADAEQIQILFANWEIVQYMRNMVPWPYPPDGTREFLARVLPAMERGEEWHWTLRLKTDPDMLIGLVTLKALGENHRGFWTGLPWQGRGFMSEAADAVTDYWFHELKFPVMRVSKAAANLASRRISEKQGMRLTGTTEVDYVGGRLPSEIWEITAEEWDARRRAK